MPVKIDPDGRRWIAVEVEVPGTVEEVWRAIATGPGISAWFVPTELEEQVGGRDLLHFGPDPSMDSESTITAWEPPHRFAAEGVEPMGEGASPMGTEWHVETRSGDTCVVRVVHSLFTEKDDWDGFLESIEAGWPAFFRFLRRYLSDFRGEPAATIQVMGTAPPPMAEAWQAFTGALGVIRREGEPVSTADGAPPLAGTLDWVFQPDWGEELMLALTSPAPGTGHLYAQEMGEQVFLTVRLYLYGDRAASAAAEAEPLWQRWMSERFPMPAMTTVGD
jgi:uncharacterized protein YndB with AHSA1/START domain